MVGRMDKVCTFSNFWPKTCWVSVVLIILKIISVSNLIIQILIFFKYFLVLCEIVVRFYAWELSTQHNLNRSSHRLMGWNCLFTCNLVHYILSCLISSVGLVQYECFKILKKLNVKIIFCIPKGFLNATFSMLIVGVCFILFRYRYPIGFKVKDLSPRKTIHFHCLKPTWNLSIKMYV